MNSIFDYMYHQVVADNSMVFEMCSFKKDFGPFKIGDQFHIIEVSSFADSPRIHAYRFNGKLRAGCTNDENMIAHPLTRKEYFEIVQ